MFSILRNLTYLSLLCTWSVCIIAQDSVVRSFSKKFTTRKPHPIRFNGEEVHFTKIGDSFLNYICQYSEDSNSQLCNVTVQGWPFAHGTYFATCENYKLSDNKKEILVSYLLSDNIILFLLENGGQLINMDNYIQYNLTILNMDNCTTMANIPIATKVETADLDSLLPIRFDKIFEIRVNNEIYCDGMPSCKISYDFNGRQIGDPKPFPMEYNQNLSPVFNHLPEAGYYSMRCNNRTDTMDCLGYEVQYIDSSGSSKKLMTESEPKKFVSLSEISFKNDNGLFSFCQIDHLNLKRVHCLQFDTQTARMNVTIKLHKKAGAVAVHNLDGGGMLVLIIHCGVSKSDEDISEGLTGCNEFWIQRIGADGHKFKALIIDGFDIDYASFDPSYRVITENDQNEFCFISSGRMRQSNYSDNYETRLYNKLCIPKQSILKL